MVSLSSINPVCNDSDDEKFITAVGGAIAFIAAYHQFQDDTMMLVGRILTKTVVNEEKTLWIIFCSLRQKLDHMRVQNAIF